MIVRWLRFNAVGLAGVVVQLSALFVLSRLWPHHEILDTMLAVEIAILHNFVWHETWTWPGLTAVGRSRRLVRFHLANGFLSIASNALFTWLFRHSFGIHLLAANLAAIAVTSLLNFAVAARWVFRRSEL
jgi:putative flippase GtrA